MISRKEDSVADYVEFFSISVFVIFFIIFFGMIYHINYEKTDDMNHNGIIQIQKDNVSEEKTIQTIIHQSTGM
jgi:hypothetical protein